MSTELFIAIAVVDALGRPVTTTDPGGNVSAYIYDKSGALKTVQLNGDPYVNDIHYDAKGQRQAIWYGNGTKTGYTYDTKTFRLRRLLTVNPATAEQFQDLNYYYDPVGNITTIRDDAQQSIFFNNTVVAPTQTFTYDALYRLMEAKGREQKNNADFGSSDNSADGDMAGSNPLKWDSTALQLYTQKYTYDKVGNILQLKHIADTGSYTRDYNNSSSSNKMVTTEVGSWLYTYGYDTRGNMTTMPHLSDMNWNAVNELHRVTKGVNNTYYQYGGGQRIRKYTDKGIVKEERIYLGSYEIYRKFDSTGSLKIVERTTVHVSDDTGRIAMLEKRTSGNAAEDNNTAALLTRYIYSNHLQSASLELDEAADIISYEEYHPYGTTAYQANNSAMNAVAKRYRYTGKERDEESGLYYHGARYYVPWLCRWCACDPLESKYAGMSPYNYCENNPVMKIDTDGMLDGWVRTTNNEIAYNSGISSQEEASEVYGHGAEYLDEPDELSYTGVKGHSIILAEGGNYTSDGQKMHTRDDANFNKEEAAAGWASGFVSNLYERYISGKKGMTLQDLSRSLGETGLSINKLNDIVSDDSPRHEDAANEMRHDFKTFLKKPSYNQGFIVGGYSYWIAENATLAYVMGAGAPKVPIKPMATFEESFPGWYGRTSGATTKASENLAFGIKENLNEFSEATGFKNYKQFTSGGFKPDEIRAAIENPNNNLHFNLNDFTRGRYLKYVNNPVSPSPALNNITNWELHTIYNTPGALQRTTFYKFLNGSYLAVPKPF